MSTSAQPLKDSGDHPPGISFHMKCESNDGSNVSFAGNHFQALTLSVPKPEDAAYFVVGQSYVVFFAALGQ